MENQRKIVCFASGDSCHGCAHYHGKSEVCEHKKQVENQQTPEEILKNHVTIFNEDSPDKCFIDSHPKRIIAAMEQYKDQELSNHQEANVKLQAFKDYVHKRLDDAGIEKEPNGEHSKSGCRIGDRFDIVEKIISDTYTEVERLQEANSKLVEALRDIATGRIDAIGIAKEALKPYTHE